MYRTALRSLTSRPLRTALTTLAILLGVAMISGTYVLTDQITNGFNDIFDTAYAKMAVVVTPKQEFGAQDGSVTTMPVSTLDQVRAVPGVKVADGGVMGLGAVIIDGKRVKTSGAPTMIESAGDAAFSTGYWKAGGVPDKSGDIAVTSLFAEKHDLTVGDTLQVVTPTGVQTGRVSGVFAWPAEESLGGSIMISAPLADVQKWFRLEDKLTAINVAAQPGVSADELRTRIAAALPGTVDVKTGKQAAADQSKDTSAAINSFLRPALLAFGGVSVFVGAFIIFNAFSITVAQRRREFAMLRALGGSRSQVLTSVVAEAGVMGLAASLLGLAAGLGVAKLINTLFKAIGADIPASGVALEPRTIVVALIVGVGVTVVSALVPALRATRVPPVAALQEGAEMPSGLMSRLNTPIAVAIALAGVVLMVLGMTSDATTTTRLLEMAAGAMAGFVAIAMLAKFVVKPLAMVIGRPLQWLAPTSGRLARENAARNPQRTAATAAALMIGLALVVFVAVFAQGMKSSVVDALAKANKADVVVTDDSSYLALPAPGVAAVKALPDVETATGVAMSQVKVGSKVLMLQGLDPQDFPNVWKFDWIQGGSDALLAKLDGTNAVVEEQYAKANGLRIGSAFTALTQQGKTKSLTVIGEYRDPMLFNGIAVSTEVFKSLGLPADPQVFLVRGDGVSATTLKDEVGTALAGFPTHTVRTEADYDKMMKQQVNQLLMMLYALLAMAVTISVFGIVNTLVLSVYERTREIGMLRAIGTSRRQMRRIVRYESVITSVIGGLLGTAIGVVFAYVITAQFGSQGFVFSVPYGQLVVFLVAAGLVGVLAAVLPARRAARVNILEAIHYE
jgi:putative ABC transport system permease protein